jgi:Ni,Fe-hydrogenase III component G
MAAKIAELEEQFNEQVEKNIELKSEIAESVKEKTLAKTAEGLTESQAIKLASLAEGVEFEDAETYAEKLETIKENYFGEEVDLSEEVNMDEEIVEVDDESEATVSPEMSYYMNAIAKSIKK